MLKEGAIASPYAGIDKFRWGLSDAEADPGVL
jgi:hypothetical protein